MKRLPAVTSVVILLLCVTIACGRKGPDAPPDKTPPAVASTNPALGSVDVPSNTVVSFTFSEPVDEKTITFVLMSAGTGTVPGTMSYSDKTAVFTPSSDLAYNTQYFATISAGVIDQIGNVMPSDYPWSFTTGTAPDTTPPTILPDTLAPASGAPNVPIYPIPIISVTFSEPMNPSTVNTGTVKVSGNGSDVLGTVILDNTSTKAIFMLSGSLAYGTTYTVTIVGGASGVKDMAGNALAADYTWSFNTEPQPPYTITASAGANGTISPAGSVGVNSGASQQFTITPNTGYRVATVLVDGSAVGPITTYTFTNIAANHTIAASFSINTYTVTPSSGANGTISPSTAQTVNYNGTTSFTVTPSVGYSATVGGSCSGTLVGNTYTTNPVIVNCTVVASFAINAFTVTPSVSGGNGSITPNTPQAVNYNATPSFTVTPATGYHINTVGGTCGGTLVGNTYTTNPVTANCTIVATFSINTYTVTPSSGANGTISPSTAQTVNYNGTTSFTVTPSVGYSTVMSGSCGGTLVGNIYTTNPVIVNCTVVASFAINAFTVTPSVSGGNGSITPNTPQAVNYNATPSFTVTPATGYHINTVGGTCGGTLVGNTYTTNPVTANCTIVASFAVNTYTITASAGTGGNISPLGPVVVNYGASQTFAITPNAGYSAAVGGTCGGTLVGNTYTTNPVTGDCTVTASFSSNSYALTVTMSGTGTGNVTDNTGTLSWNGNIGTATYLYGTVVTLTASADPSSTFSGWTGCDSVNGSQCTLNINGAKNVTAAFAINTFTVTPSVSGGHGTISPNTVQTVNYNGTASFTLLPTTGYHIVTPVGGTCAGTLSGSTFTTNPVTGNCTVVASFAIDTYTITATADANGSITPSGPVTVNYNTNQAFAIAPNAGYHIVDVLVDGASVGSVTTYTFTKVKDDHTISATFAINTFTVTPSAKANGSISPNAPQTVNYNDTTTFAVTPDAGYSAVMSGTCGGTLVGNTYTTKPVTANCTVVASFAVNTYTITASAGTGGSISPSGPVVVNYGGSQTFTITPDTGFSVDVVLVDGVSQVPAPPSYIFSDVTADHTISATFLQ